MTTNMTTKWYHYKLGKTRGPFSFSNIKLQITTNQITQDDLVYKSDLNKWIKVKDLEEFQKLEPLQNISELHKMFVILKHNTHKQLGPFLMDTVIEKIHSGEVEFCDYIWKKGMKSWKQISTFIKPMPKKQEAETSPKEDLGNLSKDELLTSVVQLYELNETPTGTEGQDLAKQFGNLDKKAIFQETPFQNKEEAIIDQNPIKLLDDENTTTSINKPGFKLHEFFKNLFLSLCKFSKKYLMIFILLFSYPIASNTNLQAIKYEFFKNGKELNISGVANQNIDIVIKNRKNQILSKNAFYQNLTLKLNNSGQAILRLDQWSLPIGFYILQIKTKNQKVISEFFFGKNISKFKTKLAVFNKAITI